MFFLSVKRLALRAGQRQGGVFRLPPPYLWTPLSPQRVKGCSPLTIPKRKSKPKNASRFAKRTFFVLLRHLRLRRRFYALLLNFTPCRERNTRCEAANRRNEKKAFSAAASFFPFRLSPSGSDQGASSPLISCLPRLESRGCFSGSLLARKRELSLTVKAIYPAPQAREPHLTKPRPHSKNFYFFVSDFIKPPSAMIFWMKGGKGSA